jgi:hypothetical protein
MHTHVPPERTLCLKLQILHRVLLLQGHVRNRHRLQRDRYRQAGGLEALVDTRREDSARQRVGQQFLHSVKIQEVQHGEELLSQEGALAACTARTLVSAPEEWLQGPCARTRDG